ncbi:hypothetical protein QVD17_16986 [Tagetes erecta]|uniref:Uncharacterized protein n=1 Tax=Tagetes erecta TaxID=13708 RepID=A0AAD8KSC2_TARER|nr:hypothetical protein QVD17_16986 [Tagetes erecta]
MYLLVLDKSTFDTIAGHCGRIIKSSNADLYDVNLSVKPMVILVNSAQKVSKEVSILWNKKMFKCWIIETESHWKPEFLNKPLSGFFTNNAHFTGSDVESPTSSDDCSNSTSCKHSMHATTENKTVSSNEMGNSVIQDLEEGEILVGENPERMEEDDQSPIDRDILIGQPVEIPKGHGHLNVKSNMVPQLNVNSVNIGPDLSRKRPRVHDHLECDFPTELNRVFGPSTFGPGIPFALDSSSNRIIGTQPPPTLSFHLSSSCNPPLDSSNLQTPSSMKEIIYNQAEEHQTLFSSLVHAPPNTDLPTVIPGLDHAASVPGTFIVDTSNQSIPHSNNLGGQPEDWVSREATDTLLLARELGINMENHVDLVIETIEGKGSNRETQLADSERIPFSALWDGTDYDSVAVNSSGRSGGLACCWDKSIFQKNQVFKSSNYIIVSGQWLGVNREINLANIYGPKDPADKRRLWEELCHLKSLSDGLWVFMGDFNAIRNSNDRSSSSGSDTSIDDFNDFIHQAELVEYQMGGSSEYTWMKDDGSIFSKLDRFLVCDRFFNLWPLASVSCLPRKWSDHNPLVLITRLLDYGPCPFKTYDSWLTDSSLIDVVKSSWESSQIYGATDFVLARKLKFLKGAIREWHSNKLKENEKIERDLESKSQHYEAKALLNSLTVADHEIWRNTKRLQLRRLQDCDIGHSISWLRWIPPNVLSFIWKLDIDRIPVTSNLIQRGVPNLSPTCSLCSLEIEDTNHLFLNCVLAKEVWNKLSWWVSYDFSQVVSVKDLTIPFNNPSIPISHQKVLTLIVYSTLWFLWKSRNKWIFERKRASADSIIEDIKSHAFLWATNRCSSIQGDWEVWCIDPLRGIRGS